MIGDEFEAEQVSHYVVSGASDIGCGLPNLSVMPCSVRIDDFSTNMAKARRGYNSTDEFQRIFSRRRQALKRYLRQNFDFVIVDCPPSIALQVHVFLAVAIALIVPCVPDRLSVRGSLYLLDRIRIGTTR